jgi:hypothetical protein
MLFNIKAHYTYKNHWVLKTLRTEMCYLNRCFQCNMKKTLNASVDLILQNIYDKYLPSFNFHSLTLHCALYTHQ